MENRKCWVCKIEYPLTKEYFYKDITDNTGFQKSCKTCQSKRNKQYLENNREYFKNKCKSNYRREKNPERYLKYKDRYLSAKKIFEESIRGKMYNLLESARQRSKKKNLEIDIDLDFLVELYNENNGRCLITNMEFQLIKEDKHKNKISPFSPSLDRIIPSNGYLKTNVRLICTIVNLSLNEFGDDYFDIMCKSYMEYKYGQKI